MHGRPDAGTQLGAAFDAKRHVGADPLADVKHFLGREPGAKQRVESHDDRRAVTAAAGKTRLRGNGFVDVDMYAGNGQTARLKKAVRRLDADIALVAGHALVVASDGHFAAVVIGEGDRIIQIYRLHDRCQLVIAVGTPAAHVERKINFCRRFQLDFHGEDPPKIHGYAQARPLDA